MPRVSPLLVVLALGSPLAAADGFVLIKGGTLRPGLHLDDFEIHEHPVTHAEYWRFVEAARYAPPPHWPDGRIPAGLEHHPVVFVNRYSDVRAYTNWRTQQEGRIYRLPTSSEFEYAARAGQADARFPWGNAAPEGRANFSPAGERDISRWRDRLQPVKSHPPNPWKLYDMAGNVFQMVNEHPDVTLGGYVFRITSPDDREGWAMGGSWARTAYYLELGRSAYKLEGIRQADLGFRLVREPPGSTHFRRQNRRLVAASAGDRKVFISWNLRPEDPAGIGFHVYRTQYRHAAGERITTAPITDATCFLDPNPPGPRPTQHTRGEGPDQPDGEARSYYRVRPIGGDGREGPPSEWAGLEPTAKRSGQIARFTPNVRTGSFTAAFGDIDGDGVTDAVFRLDNGINERSSDPGVPVELEGFTSWGKSIWRRPLVWHAQCFGSHNNSPVLLYDLDGDGKAEVICRAQEGDQVYLAVLNGQTGETLRKTPWTPLMSDFSRSSTRIVLGIAYLDGKTPAIITQSGLYENEIFTAYDGSLKQLWQFRSFGETNGSGAHYIVNADVNGDGRDEVFDGTTCLNADGTVRWSIYAGHPDVVAVKKIIPGRPGREVFFAVEDNTNAGAYVVDADTGQVLWKSNRENDSRWTHAHTGWVADIFADSPGMEMMTNRDGHIQRDTVLFDAFGTVIMSPWIGGWTPVNWLGGEKREMMSNNGRTLGTFNGKSFETLSDPGPNEGDGRVMYAADLAGDFRDELICSVSDSNQRRSVVIYTNPTPIRKRDVTRLADREYRTWLARNLTAGYGSYFEWQPR